jgi:hypothetical protein
MQFMLDKVHFLKINTLPSKKNQFIGKIKNQGGNEMMNLHPSSHQHLKRM